jgi:hypothetical protein
LSNQSALVSEANEVVEACGSEIDSLRAQRTVLEGKRKETENELRELITSNPAIVGQLAGLRTA